MTTEETNRSNVEVELKFRIIAPRALEIMKQLAEKESLGSYRVGDLQEIDIQDTYFDTAALDLSKAGAVLRARLVDSKSLLLTLKAPLLGTYESKAIHHRTEIEGEPSLPTLMDIRESLPAIGHLDWDFAQSDLVRIGYEGIFERWGFRETFRGRNHRTSRPIMDAGSRHVATLFLDAVEFYSPQKHSELFEIEVEAAEGAMDDLVHLSSVIQGEFQGLIEPSMKSKYQRGLEFIGLEADLRLEVKLSLPKGFDTVLEYLKSTGYITDYTLGIPSRYKVVDAYFDTADYRLRANDCYLRVRELGDDSLLVFRTFKLGDDQILETAQIKKPANRSALVEVARFLRQATIIDFSTAEFLQLPQDLSEGLTALGLHNVLDVTTDRLVFPVSDRDRHLANIKADHVRFATKNKEAYYHEVEIAIENANDLNAMRALAYTLMSKFNMVHIGEPKYFVGLDLIRTGSLPIGKPRPPLLPYSRVSMAREDMNAWARSIVNRIESKDTFVGGSGKNDLASEADQLKASIESAISRTEKSFNTQKAMALVLFVLGLVTIVGSILIATQTGSAPISAIGVAAGTAIELLVYFPFRQMMRIDRQVVLYTTLADGMRLSLEQVGDDPEHREKYIGQMWAILRGTEPEEQVR